MKKFHAYLLLGWHFLLHVLSKLFMVYRPGGIERFTANFGPEGLSPVTERERQMLAKWQSCIGCGLCEAVCAELATIPGNRLMGPQLLAESGMRDLSEAELALPSAEALEQCDCAELEAICPVGIPLCELAEFLVRLGEEARASRSEPAKRT